MNQEVFFEGTKYIVHVGDIVAIEKLNPVVFPPFYFRILTTGTTYNHEAGDYNNDLLVKQEEGEAIIKAWAAYRKERDNLSGFIHSVCGNLELTGNGGCGGCKCEEPKPEPEPVKYPRLAHLADGSGTFLMFDSSHGCAIKMNPDSSINPGALLCESMPVVSSEVVDNIALNVEELVDLIGNTIEIERSFSAEADANTPPPGTICGWVINHTGIPAGYPKR